MFDMSNEPNSSFEVILYNDSWSNITNSSNYFDDYPSLEALGPKMQAFLVTLYSLTAFFALSGNVTVIVVLTNGKRSSKELRLFLINLAVSDITMAVFSIPFTYTDFMLGRWIFDPRFCPIVQFMQHCSVIASVYTLTTIGLDRYYAIMYPINSRWTKSRGPLIVVLIWIIAVGLSTVQLIHGRADKFEWGSNEYYDCHEVWQDVEGKVYTAAIFVLTFLLPMVVLTFTYSSVGWKLWRHTSPGNADATRDHQQLLAKVKVVKMLATVVVLFAICWLPIHIFNLIIYFRREAVLLQNDNQYYTYIATFFLTHWLSMSNSFVNPVIYCFMSDNFRADLKQLVFCCCTKSAPKTSRGLTMTMRSSYGSSFRTTTTIMNPGHTSSTYKGVNYCGVPLQIVRTKSNNTLVSPDDAT